MNIIEWKIQEFQQVQNEISRIQEFSSVYVITDWKLKKCLISKLFSRDSSDTIEISRISPNAIDNSRISTTTIEISRIASNTIEISRISSDAIETSRISTIFS